MRSECQVKAECLECEQLITTTVVVYGENKHLPEEFTMHCTNCGNYEKGTVPVENFVVIEDETI